MKNPQDMEQKVGVMRESMLKIREQMLKITDAKDPQQRDSHVPRTDTCLFHPR
jgi:hypothetical protein